VTTVALDCYYGYRFDEPSSWISIPSSALKMPAANAQYYYQPPTTETVRKQQMDELPLIEDGKMKVQQIRDRQNEKKKKVRERKMNQKKQTQELKDEREYDD